ncbi:hypothetical protein DCCM_2401 [Desulfocucumis palustris]|uniref:Uncharacterized protein n=1 Tax=Desulfocucumis palustris TaxID=1898651 RepID=A0A2L2XB52_9FIRM|nr:hypothetical protein DCCM_2401 [Desulfocucumis palustris]
MGVPPPDYAAAAFLFKKAVQGCLFIGPISSLFSVRAGGYLK